MRWNWSFLSIVPLVSVWLVHDAASARQNRIVSCFKPTGSITKQSYPTVPTLYCEADEGSGFEGLMGILCWCLPRYTDVDYTGA